MFVYMLWVLSRTVFVFKLQTLSSTINRYMRLLCATFFTNKGKYLNYDKYESVIKENTENEVINFFNPKVLGFLKAFKKKI